MDAFTQEIDSAIIVSVTQEGSCGYFTLNNIEIIPNENTNIQIIKGNEIFKEYNSNDEIKINQGMDNKCNYNLILNGDVIYIGSMFETFELKINGNCKVIQTITKMVCR